MQRVCACVAKHLDPVQHCHYRLRVTILSKREMSSELGALEALVRGRRLLVLSGAGISTESGIPDYRSPERLKKPRQPMRFQEFVGSAGARRRYWARSLAGWSVVNKAQPNRAHKALAKLEQGGLVSGLITQNVDGLHSEAGSQDVLELHGGLSRVICLDCGAVEPRTRMQRRMAHLNPAFEARSTAIAPDGDADLAQALTDAFQVPTCLRCRGTLKPDVVFFGENVPKARVERAWTMLEASDALLVVGSSLTVFSGYRFVAKASKEGKPIAIINRGPTRGDKDASLKLEANVGELLPRLAKQLQA